MRPDMWKLLGGAGLASVVIVLVVGRSSVVAGDPADGAAPDEPGEYDLGPNPIPYELQPTEEQDNIDRVATTFDETHPESSSNAWGRAADQSLVAAQAEIASRHVGLEGVEDQGVVP